MDTCWHSCVKYLIFIFNLLFALAGLVILALGTYIQIGSKHYLDFLDSTYLNIPIIFIVLGCVIFIIAFFACCGACSETSWMVKLYSGLMIMVLLGQFGSSIAAFVLKDDFANSIEAQMYNGLENYNETGYEGVTETWNYVQQELQCCGIVNSTDWTDVSVKTPASCCASNKPSCSQESTDLFTQVITKYNTNDTYLSGIWVGCLINV